MGGGTHIVESPHGMPVTDVSGDGLGKHVATCSEDSTVRVYNVDADGRLQYVATLEGHEGPVSRVAWAPQQPQQQYCAALVSIGEDGQVILWDDVRRTNTWAVVYSTTLPATPWCVAWAPPNFGRMFAVGCDDGTIKVFTGRDQQWEVSEIVAHSKACGGVSWAPFLPTGALLMMPPALPPSSSEDESRMPIPYPILPPRIVSCGEDGAVYIWQHSPNDGGSWRKQELATEVTHRCWQEVAWAPNIGLPFDYIAAGSDDGLVVVWSRDGVEGPWRSCVLKQFDEKICKLCWSDVGSFLLVSCANGTATMWKECVTGEWEITTELASPSL